MNRFTVFISGNIINRFYVNVSLDAPEESFVSASEIIMREDESFPAVFCDGEADPDPEVSWWFNNALISQENTLDFSDPITR